MCLYTLFPVIFGQNPRPGLRLQNSIKQHFLPIIFLRRSNSFTGAIVAGSDAGLKVKEVRQLLTRINIILIPLLFKYNIPSVNLVA